MNFLKQRYNIIPVFISSIIIMWLVNIFQFSLGIENSYWRFLLLPIGIYFAFRIYPYINKRVEEQVEMNKQFNKIDVSLVN